jgi:hypothetical protein
MLSDIYKEWPCYIVQSAIVPGFMYLTENHVCFYASLPNSEVRQLFDKFNKNTLIVYCSLRFSSLVICY